MVLKEKHSGSPYRPVSMYDKQGNLIRKYNSVAEASKELGILPSFIFGVLSGKAKSTHNYIFKDTDNNEEVSYPLKDIVISKGKGGTPNRPVNIYKYNGKFLKRYESIKQAARELGLRASSISSIVGKEGRTLHGMIFKDADNNEEVSYLSKDIVISKGRSSNRPVNVYKYNGKFLKRFDNLNQAAEELGIKASSISSVVGKEGRTLHGMIFKYAQ